METTITAIQQFILAGKSFFTIQNKETEKRFTYKVCQATDNDKKPKDLWFVSILVGADNDNSYQYAGIITKDGFRLTAKSRVTNEAVSVKAFTWLWGMIKSNQELPDKVEFYHAGRCARCGRKLTTPESIELGFGPICAGLVGI
jgi:hypothetical protein